MRGRSAAGRRLRQIRNYRRKSLRMVAGLASLTLPPTNADTAGMIGW